MSDPTAETTDPDRFAVAVYAAICAIEDGKIAEASVEERRTVGEAELVLTVEVRREVRHYGTTVEG